MPLQAKCLDLNPSQNVWPFMRENWLSKRACTCSDQIVDHSAEAWKIPVAQPWNIMTFKMRD